jgi:hypothetical protein
MSIALRLDAVKGNKRMSRLVCKQVLNAVQPSFTPTLTPYSRSATITVMGCYKLGRG